MFDDAADLIEQFTCRFNAVGEDGYGYFYGLNTRGRYNPEHPIVKEIRDGKAARSLLFPKRYKDETRWLPAACA